VTADHRQIIAAYTDAWNAPDDTVSRAKLKTVWRDDSSYTNPTVTVTGVDALVRHIAGVRTRRPNTRIVMTGEIDAHHDVLRFSWQRVNADGSLVVSGIDIAVVRDGYIVRIIGFFDTA
jgi:hypothetical protein